MASAVDVTVVAPDVKADAPVVEVKKVDGESENYWCVLSSRAAAHAHHQFQRARGPRQHARARSGTFHPRATI